MNKGNQITPFEIGSWLAAGVFLLALLNRQGNVTTPLTVDTDLRIPSGVSARQLDRGLEMIGAHAMVGLGSAFKQAERESGVNAVFLTALAVHESNLGRSRIAREKNNLFGWGAFDATPYESALSFGSKEEGIRYVASRIRALYFNQWNLVTLRQMNTRYASDIGWANKIANWAVTLHNAIYN